MFAERLAIVTVYLILVDLHGVLFLSDKSHGYATVYIQHVARCFLQ